jgi:hypothetical protein
LPISAPSARLGADAAPPLPATLSAQVAELREREERVVDPAAMRRALNTARRSELSRWERLVAQARKAGVASEENAKSELDRAVKEAIDDANREHTSEYRSVLTEVDNRTQAIAAQRALLDARAAELSATIASTRASVEASRATNAQRGAASDKIDALRRRVARAPVQRQIAVLCAVQRRACSSEGLRQCHEQVAALKAQLQLKAKLDALAKQREGLVVRLKLALRVLVEPDVALADGTVQTLNLLGIALPAAAIDVTVVRDPKARQLQIAAMQELLRPVVSCVRVSRVCVSPPPPPPPPHSRRRARSHSFPSFRSPARQTPRGAERATRQRGAGLRSRLWSRLRI